MNRACVVCGSKFEAKTIRAKYCCKKCANHSRFNQTYEQIRENNKSLKSKVSELYCEGLTDKAIAVMIGKSTSWVRNTRIEIGLQKIHKNVAVNKEQPSFMICPVCKSVFYSSKHNIKYCSKKCESKVRHNRNDLKRKRRVSDAYVEDIPLEALYQKYHGVCYLCGELCDWNDYVLIDGHKYVKGNYPSREHVKPLSKGGLHSWDNVQLAHIRCNSGKGVCYG